MTVGHWVSTSVGIADNYNNGQLQEGQLHSHLIHWRSNINWRAEKQSGLTHEKPIST